MISASTAPPPSPVVNNAAAQSSSTEAQDLRKLQLPIFVLCVLRICEILFEFVVVDADGLNIRYLAGLLGLLLLVLLVVDPV